MFKNVPQLISPKSFSFWSLAMRACCICSILMCRALTSPSSLLFSVFSQLSSGSSAAWNKKWHKTLFSLYPLLCLTKDTPLKLRCKYETKPSDNFLPPTISPWMTKKETQKSLRGGHFVLSHPLCLSLFCAWKTEGCTLHTKPGHFFIDRNNGISYCSGAPVIQIEFIQEVSWGSWRMKDCSPCQAGRERGMEEEGEGGGIGGSPWAPFPFGGGELLSLYFSLPVSARSHQPSSRWSPQAESRMESIRSLWCPFRPCALTRLLHACHT